MDGVNQYPSQRTLVEGWNTMVSKHTAALEVESLSLGVLQ